MQDFMNMLVLICAAIASLGLGVLLAFGACKAGFAVLRGQSMPSEPAVAPAKAQTAEI